MTMLKLSDIFIIYIYNTLVHCIGIGMGEGGGHCICHIIIFAVPVNYHRLSQIKLQGSSIMVATLQKVQILVSHSSLILLVKSENLIVSCDCQSMYKSSKMHTILAVWAGRH